MTTTFNPKRLALARKRRRKTGKILAVEAGLSAVTVSRLENGENDPDEDTVARLAVALKYPLSFFFGDDPEELDTTTVSFRSLTKMSAAEREAARAAGALGLQVSAWVDQQFTLPAAKVPNLSHESDPEAAARAVRAAWGLGEQPVSNMLALLEAHGVRVFSLAEQTDAVDAFSFWWNDRPYVFLNNYKTAEHSVYDSAHELAHLAMHKHAGPQPSRSAEREANQFASAFLMPRDDVLSRMPRFITVDTVIKAKARWRVSAMAMAYRLRALGLLTEWQYKSACIELGRRGYRTGEPQGIVRETSTVWRKVLAQLWSERTTKNDIAADLNLPMDELENLIWGLTGPVARPDRGEPSNRLRLV